MKCIHVVYILDKPQVTVLWIGYSAVSAESKCCLLWTLITFVMNLITVLIYIKTESAISI